MKFKETVKYWSLVVDRKTIYCQQFSTRAKAAHAWQGLILAMTLRGIDCKLISSGDPRQVNEVKKKEVLDILRALRPGPDSTNPNS